MTHYAWSYACASPDDAIARVVRDGRIFMKFGMDVMSLKTTTHPNFLIFLHLVIPTWRMLKVVMWDDDPHCLWSLAHAWWRHRPWWRSSLVMSVCTRVMTLERMKGFLWNSV
jgi:hypothetical protein